MNKFFCVYSKFTNLSVTESYISLSTDTDINSFLRHVWLYVRIMYQNLCSNKGVVC